jgi:hypothetical protein
MSSDDLIRLVPNIKSKKLPQYKLAAYYDPETDTAYVHPVAVNAHEFAVLLAASWGGASMVQTEGRWPASYYDSRWLAREYPESEETMTIILERCRNAAAPLDG